MGDADGYFQIRRLGSDGHFALSGELDMAVTGRLLEAVQPAIDQNRYVTLDLSKLSFLDCAGVRAFAEAGQRAARLGVAIVLRSPSRPALRVLEMVRADRLTGVTILRRDGIASWASSG